ncbi:MAG: YraN family protein [Thermotogae bacterium]|nr:YraN family protein [Thermotogota bacterium]
MRTKEKGKEGERIAARFLKEKGFEIVTTNYRRIFGEVDLVAKKGGAYYFIEVKVENPVFKAKERVDIRKLDSMRAVAESFLAQRSIGDVETHFLLVIVSGNRVEVVPLDEELL